jgi:hypothetical protein
MTPCNGSAWRLRWRCSIPSFPDLLENCSGTGRIAAAGTPRSGLLVLLAIKTCAGTCLVPEDQDDENESRRAGHSEKPALSIKQLQLIL